MFEAANCTVVPVSTPSDAGIAGAGVLLSFMITAAIALVISATLILQEYSSKTPKQHVVRRKLLNSYSDQQILTGIGIQCVGLAKANTMVPYHFFLIWMLGLLSMAVHNATLLVLVHDFRRDWVLRWLRQALMFVNLALSSVYGVYLLEKVNKNLPATLPVACVWFTPGDGAQSNAGLMYVATGAVIVGNALVFGLATWYLHSRGQRFYKAIQMVGTILMAGIAIGASVEIILSSQAFGTASVTLSDTGETVWSFGQLLSILLLLLPVVSVVEIYRGEIRVAPPVQDDKASGFDGEMQPIRHSFQPNPFFGSQTNLFRRDGRDPEVVSSIHSR